MKKCIVVFLPLLVFLAGCASPGNVMVGKPLNKPLGEYKKVSVYC